MIRSVFRISVQVTKGDMAFLPCVVAGALAFLRVALQSLSWTVGLGTPGQPLNWTIPWRCGFRKKFSCHRTPS